MVHCGVMKSVKGYHRLYIRDGMYYHRTKVPEDLRASLGVREIKCSLRTKDKARAVELNNYQCVVSDKRLDAHKRAAQDTPSQTPTSQRLLSASEIQRYQDSVAIDLQTTEQAIRYELVAASKDGAIRWVEATPENRALYPNAPVFDGIEGDEGESVPILSTGGDHLPESRQGTAFEALEPEASDQLDLWSDQVMLARRALRDKDSSGIWSKQAIEFANDLGWSIDKTHPQLAELTVHLLQAYLQADKVISPYLQMKTSSIPIAPKARDESQWTLSKIRHELTALEETQKSRETLSEYERVVELIIELVGDKPLTEYDKADARAFNQAIKGLPKHWKVKPETKHLSAREAIVLTQERGFPKLSGNTIAKNYNMLGGFWNVARKSFELGDPRNPFAEVRGTGRPSTDADQQRLPFQMDEINAILAHPIYTGCLSSHRWHSPGKTLLLEDHRYWMPLLSLLTGARPGELLQLYLKDVGCLEGIWYLDINKHGEDKRLKNDYSRRIVPLHPLAEKLGFTDFVQRRRETGDQRLFSDAPMSQKTTNKKDNCYTDPYSKKAQKMLEVAGVTRDKVVFYSFRHNFEDFGRQAGIDEEMRVKLTGRKPVRQSARYGDLRQVELLFPEISKIKFEGLNFDQIIQHRVPV